MDNFNLKKYLAESKLFEQEMSFDDDIENKTNKNDFAFWYRSGARGKAQALKAQELLKQKGIDAEYSKGPFYIDFSNAGVEERVIQQMLRDANLDRFVIMRDDKDLAEGKLYEQEGKYAGELELFKKEEKMYTLFTTNVEYDNGKTGYMYQLVDSEDGEENEIGFDQLYFVGKGDASDPRVFTGKDFKGFDQGSYQEEEVSAEEAMKIYNKLK